MILTMELGERSYDIVVEDGCLAKAGEYLDLQRKVFIVTDDGVPVRYAETVARQCAASETVTLPQGEDTKSFESLRTLLSRMLAFGMGRGDCAVAVGGGVMGDLTGFAAACYMRGIDFYNIPTTVISQVDSSIGGKTAIDLDGVKNIVGAFWQPKKVLIDPQTLKTLPRRQIAGGLAEAVKMALCFDEAEFRKFEEGNMLETPEAAIPGALRIKKTVVELDERESGLRRVLNFGHTLGHGIESLHGENGLYHGECVALGMLPMCAEPVRQRLEKVLRKLELPVACDADPARVMAAAVHDKKAQGGTVKAVWVEKAGSWEIREMTPEALRERFEVVFS